MPGIVVSKSVPEVFFEISVLKGFACTVLNYYKAASIKFKKDIYLIFRITATNI